MSEGLIEIRGPFGNYPWGTSGAILNAAVRQENLPLSKVEDLSIGDYKLGDMGNLYYRQERVCLYKWIDGISMPVFNWLGEFSRYNKHIFTVQENGDVKPTFRPSLCCHGTAAFQVYEEQATPELHELLHRMLTNVTTDPCYKLHHDAGAFFQSGSHDPFCGFFMIEFWKPQGVEAFIQYLNENYVIKNG